MTSSRPETVSVTRTITLITGVGEPLHLSATYVYESADPYAVKIHFLTGEEPVIWMFGRELLANGVTHPVGDADVKVWPSSRIGDPAVCLSVSSPNGSALFELPLEGVVRFLSETYKVVPVGQECDFLDLEVELALLVWTDPY